MEEVQEKPKIKLLLLCAQFITEDSEVQLIINNLGKVCSNSVELITERVINADQVLDVISKYNPTIVHFYGNCTADESFVFADDEGKIVNSCSKRFLLKKIGDLSQEIKLAYFNGTITDNDVRASNGKIAAFVGMKKRGDADLSRRIVVPFYTALAFGNPLGFAFKKLWEALPDKDKNIMLRYRLDLNPDKILLREI